MYYDPSDIPPAYRRKWAEEERDLLAFEEPSCDAVSRLSTSEDKSEREATRMEAEPISRYDEEGRVW